MIINATKPAPVRDIGAFAWNGLRRYLNEAFVSELITDLHQVGKEHQSNVQKQARHIRFCLMQAKEYADAAERVSLVTKPTLYYYSTMCLALAETLLKQDGDSSLDRAREQHSHHGLYFQIIQSKPTIVPSLTDAAAALRAEPATTSCGKRYGTFELWHRSARELPIVGLVATHHNVGGTTSGSRVLFGPPDARLAELPSNGVTLLEAISKLPAMTNLLDTLGVVPKVVATSVHRQYYPATPKRVEWTITIHPTRQSLVDRLIDNFLFDASAHSELDFVPFGNGGVISYSCDDETYQPKGKIPHACTLTANRVWFWPEDNKRSWLNEFGWYYIALFIAGNYARYYPDKWVADVEQYTPLALAIDELLRSAVERVPLLALSELSRVYFVPSEVMA
jgi:hypothetical protein